MAESGENMVGEEKEIRHKGLRKCVLGKIQNLRNDSKKSKRVNRYYRKHSRFTEDRNERLNTMK